MPTKPDEERDGVKLTNLDQQLFDFAGVTKRELIDYLDAMTDRMLPVLRDRELSVIRVMRGQDAFMQKNVPKYTPSWVRTVEEWAESSKRTVRYAVCDDRKTLLWFGNQRAIEYHPSLLTLDHAMTHLVLDLDPPEGAPFTVAVQAALLVRAALIDAGLDGAAKTSGAKGVHVFVPIAAGTTIEDAMHATRAIAERAAALDPDLATTEFVKDQRGGKVFVDATRAGGATVISAYSPRFRPSVPVSMPVTWDELESVTPLDFTLKTALGHLGDRDPWAELMPDPFTLPADLVGEGAAIPTPRVAAMHEGKRRKRAEREAES